MYEDDPIITGKEKFDFCFVLNIYIIESPFDRSLTHYFLY